MSLFEDNLDLSNFKTISFEDLNKGFENKNSFLNLKKEAVGKSIRGMNNVSPLVVKKFYNQTLNDISSKYFPDASSSLEGSFTYVSDIRSDLSQYIKSIDDFFYGDKRDKEHFAFKVILFSSTEATKLKECFDVCKPKGKEILMFLEDNKEDTASATYGSIRISDELVTFFKNKDKQYKGYNFLAFDLKDNANLHAYIKQTIPNLTSEQIESLMSKGFIEDNRLGLIADFFKLANFLSASIDKLFPGMNLITSDAARIGASLLLGKAVEKIEEYRLPDNTWQPNPPKNEQGETDKNYKYEPLISVGDDKGTINIKQVNQILTKKLDVLSENVKNILKISSSFDGNTEPKSFFEFFYLKYLQAYKIGKGIIAQLGELSDLQILKYGVRAYNALLCGVWNALVDAVSSLFGLVKMIFDGITLGKDFAKNVETFLPTILEQFDEALQAIEKMSFSEMAKYVFDKLKESNLTFDPIACSYFVGYAYGFIISLVIEVIVGIIASGGTLSIAAIVNGVIESVVGIFRLGYNATKGAVKAIRTFAKFVVKSIEDLISSFHELLRLLKGEKGSFKKIIDEVFEASDIKKIGEFGGKVLSEVEIENWAKLVKKKFGTNLQKVDSFDEPNVLAQFDPNTNTIKYMDDVTEYLMAHESFHAEEMYKIGFDNFVKDCPLVGVKQKDYTPENWIRLYKREKYVYDKIIENKKILKINDDELEHADLYIEVIQLRMRDRGIKF